MNLEQRGILLLGSQMTLGGAQRLLLDLAGWLSDHGWKVTVAFLYDKDGCLPKWRAEYPFPIMDLQARTKDKTSPVGLSIGLLRFYRLLRYLKPAVVLTFTHHANMLGLPVAWLAGAPVRLGSHHGRIHAFRKSLETLHAWVINSSLSTGLVVISDSVRQSALDEGVRPEKLYLVGSGVPDQRPDAGARERLRAELGVGSDEPLILSVGRLNPEKGHRTLLSAFAILTASQPHGILTLAGDGSERAALEDQARALGIASRVRFLGYRQDIPNLLAACDVFVQPSNHEGLPLAVLEAMLASRPVLATRVGGHVELAGDETRLALTPPGDVQAMAERIGALLSDPRLREQMAANAEQYARTRYTLDRMCAGYATLFQEIYLVSKTHESL